MANLGTDGSAGPLTASTSPASVTLVAGAPSGATFAIEAKSDNTVNFQFSASGMLEQPAGVVNDYADVQVGSPVYFVVRGATAVLTYKSASGTPVAYVRRVKVGVPL